MGSNKNKKYRRIYPYKCGTCGKPRMTLVYDRKNHGICHTCSKSIPVPGQISIIETAQPNSQVSAQPIIN